MKILPADIGAAKAFEFHLSTCGLYHHQPTEWSNPYCTCDPVGRLAAAFAAHRLEHERPYTDAEISNMRTGGMG